MRRWAYLAGTGIRVPVGTSVALMPLRGPYDAAVQARSLAALTERPAVAAFGVGPPELADGLLGAPYARPVTAATEYARCVRALLAGRPVAHDGEYVKLRFGMVPLAHPRVEVGLGVLRPAMARAAGAVADVAVTWMTPPWYLRHTLAPALAAGAGERRSRPRVVAVVHVALARRGRDPRRLALRAAGPHLASDHYTAMLREAGVAVDASDPDGGARAIAEAGVFVYGSTADVIGEIARYRAAGVDEVVVNTAGVYLTEGPDAALDDLGELLTALHAPAG
jgi:alkanesulfonate monooxygenase SsuD/methylene tetrahydromethanopterin reductase-like flavin-dependent oxidoreductase (luciferase family)